jgi:hypothetical protein
MHELGFLLFKCKIDHLKQQKIPMKGKTRASNRSSVDEEGKNEAAFNQSVRKANYGDLLWVQLHGSSWWPAQVREVKLKLFCSSLVELCLGFYLFHNYCSFLASNAGTYILNCLADY